jgi:GTPase involved in cell partitioning and DNA repair
VGLGIRFLKHIERTRFIAHLIDTSDASDRDPVHDFEIIENELSAFSEKLAEKPVMVVATKLDATTDRARLDKLRNFCASRGLEFHAVSAATGEGIPQLVRAMADALDRLAPHQPVVESANVPETDPVGEAAPVGLISDEHEELPDAAPASLAPVPEIPKAPRRKVARAPRKPRLKKEDR